MLIIKQLIKFGLIGSLAALVHMSVLYRVVSLYSLDPLIANIIAFFIAFNISFFGHYYWTFANEDAEQQISFRYTIAKFFLVAFSMFCFNESLFYVFFKIFHLHYLFAIFLVLSIVPPITFVLSKWWAFNPSFIRTTEIP